jgi:hypothetical protein
MTCRTKGLENESNLSEQRRLRILGPLTLEHLRPCRLSRRRGGQTRLTVDGRVEGLERVVLVAARGTGPRATSRGPGRSPRAEPRARSAARNSAPWSRGNRRASIRASVVHVEVA